MEFLELVKRRQSNRALMITLGYPADTPRAKKRKSFEEVVKWNKYK